MKVGILTFHHADNYGAVLQSYALQQVLRRLGADSAFVAMPTKPQATPNPVVAQRFAAFSNRIKAEQEKRSAHFAQFRQEHLSISKLYQQNDLEALVQDYDLFLAGSDQVWNVQIPDTDPRYFLPFAPGEKRCSYAASFGSAQIPEKVAPWCARQLEQFRSLSVREESGRAIIQQLTGRDCAVCLDPTLLLEQEEWEELVHPVEKEPYLLAFFLNYDAEGVARANTLAQERGLKLRVVTAGFVPQLGFEPWSGTGVEDWLSLIYHAQGVVTNSFHGTVFSILFERPLCVVPLGGELAGRNGRMEELLDKTGMMDCMNGTLAAPDYAQVKKRLERLKAGSLEYLRGVLKDSAN